MIDLRLHLGDTVKLQIQVVADVVKNPAALVQDLNRAIELGAGDTTALWFRDARKPRDLARATRYQGGGMLNEWGVQNQDSAPEVTPDPPRVL
jgi:hypothetical protein